LCEPARSKSTWTSHKIMFMRESTGKKPRPKIGNRDAHFARASLGNRMHMDISQEFLREFAGNMPCPKIGTFTLREPARSNCTWTSQEKFWRKNLEEKMPRPKIGTLALSEPARTKYARGSHNRHFRRESAGKMRMPGPRSSKTSVAHCAYAAEMLTWTCHGYNFLRIYCKKAGAQDRDAHQARACGVEMHMDTSQEMVHPFRNYSRVSTR
jgi:hypothetical protein